MKLSLQLGPFVILLATACYIQAHWNQIPDRFPVHWGINGMPDGWSGRTPLGVYGPLLFGAALVIAISVPAYAISHSTQRVSAAGGTQGQGEFAHRTAVVLLGVEYFIAAVLSLVALLPFTGNPGMVPIVILTVGILASAFFLSRWLGRGRDWSQHIPGSDACWKLGMFYFNPDDPALFVEKRIGIGYTINFAHGSSWIVLALTLVLPLGLGALALWHR
ncbi:MAG TPA: DUF5808 domain-containing protein [Candidatus Cybelea sp.]|nr:DUF5808 domain-containing protein [Candidatus Cybelea sp.]